MDLIWEGLKQAVKLIITFDAVVIGAAFRSLWVSGLAVGAATVVGLPIGSMLARVEFVGRHVAIMLFRAGMAIPTVFMGVVCYAIFTRRGPLGELQMLYTPWVIVAGEFVLALPIVISLSHGAIKAMDRRVGETAITLGAGLLRRWRTYLSEARVGVVLAAMTAFARCVTELGIAVTVGGNLRGRTQTLATVTAEAIRKGEFGVGMAVGLILVSISLGVFIVIVVLSREDRS